MARSDFERAFEFMLRGDLAGTRKEPWRFGAAVFTPELPLRHDSNYLVLEREGDPAELAAEAERAQAALGHRLILVPDAALGERLAPAFERLGWETQRFVVMAHRRAPERAVDTALAVEVDDETLRGPRERQTLCYPWATPEVARQLSDARRLNPLETRFYAVLVEGEVASFTDLYLDRDTAQVEAVVTLPEFRNRGYASAVVSRAVEEARRAGAALIFLVADASDWPKELYRRLGFDEVGRYVKLGRVNP